MSEEQTITLTEARSAYNFRRGRVAWPPRWSRRWWANKLWRLFWWRQPTSVVTAVDVEVGTVTVAPVRWSWWRWKVKR